MRLKLKKQSVVRRLVRLTTHTYDVFERWFLLKARLCTLPREKIILSIAGLERHWPLFLD